MVATPECAALSPERRSTTAVVVPVKSFELAKTRLAGAVTDRQRADLARALATRVLVAAGDLPRFVVCGDPTVARWALAAGANVIWYEPAGLNRAVQFAADRLRDDGFDRLIVAHGDLPLARDLTWVAARSTVTIVADRHRRGTNVMSVPLGWDFRFHYGEDSARAHRNEAERLGLDVAVVDDPELGWDIDHPGDLLTTTGVIP